MILIYLAVRTLLAALGVLSRRSVSSGGTGGLSEIKLMSRGKTILARMSQVDVTVKNLILAGPVGVKTGFAKVLCMTPEHSASGFLGGGGGWQG